MGKTDGQKLKIEYLSLDEIKPYGNNPRKNDGAVDALANSIKEFGFKQPIIIDDSGVIVCGHTRYKAAKKLGLAEIPCIRANDLTPEQLKAFRLADNKIAELSGWDFGLLDIEFGLLDIELESIPDIDMSELGFLNDLDIAGDLDDFFTGEGTKSTTKTKEITCPYCGKKFNQ